MVVVSLVIRAAVAILLATKSAQNHTGICHSSTEVKIDAFAFGMHVAR
jgi:hypothetical protein